MSNNSPPDVNDPVSMAVRLGSLENLVAQNSGIITQSIRELRDDVRSMGEKIGELAATTMEHAANSHAIERAFNAIEVMGKRMDERVEAQNRATDIRIEQHMKWRTDHEKENAETERKLSRWSGLASAASLFVFMIVSLVVYIYQNEKTNSQRDTDTARDLANGRAEEADRRLDHQEQVTLLLCAQAGKDCRPSR